MKVLYEVHDRVEDELMQVVRKEELSMNDVDCIFKMVDIIKDITTIEAMKNAKSYSYDESTSYTRGRDSIDRYPSRDSVTYRGNASFSNHDEIIENLKMLMMNARTEEERENYRKTIEQLRG